MPESFDVRLSTFDFRKMPSDKFSFLRKNSIEYRTPNIEMTNI